MRIKGKIIGLNINYITHNPQLILELDGQDNLGEYDVLKDEKSLDIEIAKIKEKRSNDANSYMWVLCQDIAEVIRSTKLEVYRKAISEVGQFEVLPIKDEAVRRFIDGWQHKGYGWICETIGESKFRGFTNVIAYYGSSVYDTKSMSILVDYVVEEAKELGIETMPPDELQALKDSWKFTNSK